MTGPEFEIFEAKKGDWCQCDLHNMEPNEPGWYVAYPSKAATEKYGRRDGPFLSEPQAKGAADPSHFDQERWGNNHGKSYL